MRTVIGPVVRDSLAGLKRNCMIIMLEGAFDEVLLRTHLDSSADVWVETLGRLNNYPEEDSDIESRASYRAMVDDSISSEDVRDFLKHFGGLYLNRFTPFKLQDPHSLNDSYAEVFVQFLK